MATSTRQRFLIIGNGAAGSYASEAIRKNDPGADVTLVTDEPYPLYNRVALPPFLQPQRERILELLNPIDTSHERMSPSRLDGNPR